MPSSTSAADQWSAQLSVPLNPHAEFIRAFESCTDGPRTTLPVANPTTSFWTSAPDANPLATEGSSGSLTQDADICIIGSGITGVSTAYHLAKASTEKSTSPLKVVIVEAREFCSGATGRNGGHLTANPCTGFRDLQNVFGTKETIRGYDLEKYTVTQVLKILKEENLEKAVDLVKGGRIDLFVSSSDYENARADYEAAKAAGMDLKGTEWLDKEYMQKTFNVAYPAFKYKGNNLWPLKLVTELYRLTKRQGSIDLHLHTRTPVISINLIDSSDSKRRWELMTQRGAIQCTRIVHATNGYASYLLPHLHGVDGIVPTRGQIIALRANVPSEHLGQSAWDSNEGGEYWFPRPPSPGKSENALVICGGARAAAGSPYESYISDDSTVNEKISKALKDFLPGLFDGVFEKGREPEMEWTGIMGYTKLWDPFVGPVLDPSQPDKEKFKGQFISAGYQGHGMPRAFACAQVVAAMITAEIEGTSFEQPPWLPDHYLTSIRGYRDYKSIGV